MSSLNSSGDIRSSFVEHRVHFGTPARGEILPPSKDLVKEAFRYLSCSRAFLVVEKREPHFEHLKKSSSSLGPDPIFSTLSSWIPVEYRGYPGGFLKDPRTLVRAELTCPGFSFWKHVSGLG